MGKKIRIRCSECNKVLLDAVAISKVEIKCPNCKKKYFVDVKAKEYTITEI